MIPSYKVKGVNPQAGNMRRKKALQALLSRMGGVAGPRRPGGFNRLSSGFKLPARLGNPAPVYSERQVTAEDPGMGAGLFAEQNAPTYDSGGVSPGIIPGQSSADVLPSDIRYGDGVPTGNQLLGGNYDATGSGSAYTEDPSTIGGGDVPTSNQLLGGQYNATGGGRAYAEDGIPQNGTQAPGGMVWYQGRTIPYSIWRTLQY